jgi:hypothetical protein
MCNSIDELKYRFRIPLCMHIMLACTEKIDINSALAKVSPTFAVVVVTNVFAKHSITTKFESAVHEVCCHVT